MTSSNSVHPSSVTSSWVIHERPGTKPCWASENRSSLIIWLASLSLIIDYLILPITGVRLTGLSFRREIFYPFLWIGIMWASFHASGSVIIDLLNIICKYTFIALDSSFSTCGWNPSGLADLFNLFLFFLNEIRSNYYISECNTFLSLINNRYGVCVFPSEHTSEVLI